MRRRHENIFTNKHDLKISDCCIEARFLTFSRRPIPDIDTSAMHALAFRNRNIVSGRNSKFEIYTRGNLTDQR